MTDITTDLTAEAPEGWFAFYRHEGPTMEHYFRACARVSVCGRVLREPRPWGKTRAHCARCEKAAS